MEDQANLLYEQMTDLHFAVWNMIKPVNYIWVSFTDKCVRCGVKDEPDDSVQTEREAAEAKKDAFVELIAYDDDGKPILGFDEPIKTDEPPYTSYPVSDKDLAAFLGDMEDIELLSWRNQFPSLREGLCWRIDVYYGGEEKHMSGQSRFPQNWAAFGKSLNKLVQTAKGN